ncbi:hypothetical protein AMTR_s00001p00231230, partial [Amborella trichopoda]
KWTVKRRHGATWRDSGGEIEKSEEREEGKKRWRGPPEGLARHYEGGGRCQVSKEGGLIHVNEGVCFGYELRYWERLGGLNLACEWGRHMSRRSPKDGACLVSHHCRGHRMGRRTKPQEEGGHADHKDDNASGPMWSSEPPSMARNPGLEVCSLGRRRRGGG